VPDSVSSPAPLVLVTATTGALDGRPRVRLNVAYVRALEAAGLVPLITPPLDPAHAGRVLDVVQGLVLTGGEDVAPRHFGAEPHPALGDVHEGRDAWELALAREARARALPTLAICRGIQLLNVALGGTLVQDLPSERPGALPHAVDDARTRRVQEVQVAPRSRLAAALGTGALAVNSLHHQALDRPADGLLVTARTTDGVVEGAEWAAPDWWAVGVQWHPEELVDDAEAWDRNLFAAFAEQTRRVGRAASGGGREDREPAG